MSRRVLILPFLLALLVIVFQFLFVLSLSTIKGYESTAIIEDSNGIFLTEGDASARSFGYWSMDGMDKLRVAKGVISIEDRRFYKHFGVDIRSIFRAIRENLIHKIPQGASTIAMQVVRIQEQSRRSIIIKLYETIAAYVMTVRYGRDTVLNQYMTIVPLGKRIHGFSYGARRYFKKPVRDLSWAEAAVLASLPKAPGRMDLTTFRGMKFAKERASLVLSRLLNQEYIDSDTYKREFILLDGFRALNLEHRPSNSSHYLLRLKSELGNRDLGPFTTPIKTHFDSDLQGYLRNYVNSIYHELTLKDVNNLGIIIADSHGGILAYIGSANYFNQEAGGAINYANRRRSSGSTLKPFLYIKGLDDKIFTPASIIDDLPIQIIGEEGSYIAANYDENFLGPMLYRKTLANSRNIPSVRILEKVGLSEVYNYFNGLNFVHRDLSPSYYGYGMILGGLYVTLEGLVTGYGSILNDGKKFNIKWFEGDDNRDGISVGSSFNSRLISRFLSDPIARLPSFKRLDSLEYDYPVAIKTGTSQGFRDGWTVAYSRDYITGIWLGRNDNGKMNHVSGSIAAKYLKPVMDHLHPEQLKGINIKPFELPENCIGVEICTLSGDLKGPNCDNSITEFFRESEAPTDMCKVHISLAIDRRTGALATHQTPINRIESRPFTKLPSRYAVWGQKNNIKLPDSSDFHNSEQAKIEITQPVDGARYLFDYELPSRFQTIPLIVDVEPNLPDVEWLINGSFYKKQSFPYKTRYKLEPGSYEIQAVSGSIKSNLVRIHVD